MLVDDSVIIVRAKVDRSDDDGVRLDRWFKRHLPQVGFATVSRWARTGQIRVDGKRATPGDRIEAGQQIRVPPAGSNDKLEVHPTRALSKDEMALLELACAEEHVNLVLGC